MKFKHTLRPVHLTAVIFFTVSGGTYGLEPLLHNAGGSMALALIIITPIVWSLPVILMMLELNGLMHKEGGYYQWVKSALGMSWGFYEGWWSWLFTLTDLAIYPVLFVQYLTFFFPEAETYKIPICLFIIWFCAYLNLRGILSVGRSSIMLGVAVLVPFLVMFVVAIFAHSPVDAVHPMTPAPFTFGIVCVGLFNVMWNFLGWDNTSTITEEVESPVRSYLIAIIGAMAMIVLIYFFSTQVGIHSGIDPMILEEEGFPALGLHIGGWWLGALLSSGGMASAIGLFVACLLMISRIPKVMADDRLLPSPLQRLHPNTEVPHVSIIVCAVVVSFMTLWTFGELIIIDVTLYSAALIPEFIALIVLRKKLPDATRPFRIPLGTLGLVVLTLLPIACIALALIGLFTTGSVDHTSGWFALAAVASGPVVWWGVRRRRRIDNNVL